MPAHVLIFAYSCQDCENNTYSCLRTVTGGPNEANSTLYCHFYADDKAWASNTPYMREYYDVYRDRYQMNNTVSSLSTTRLAELEARLIELRNCSGAAAGGSGSGSSTTACGQNGP